MSAPRPIVIIGAGGFGREVLDVLRAADEGGSTWRFLGFVADQRPDPGRMTRIGAQWLGPIDAYATDSSEAAFVIGIGDPRTRSLVANGLLAAGNEPATLLHPRTSNTPINPS